MPEKPSTQKKSKNYKAEGAQEFLKGTEDKEIGIYCDIFSAKSGITGQDGWSRFTELLVKGFEGRLF